MTLQIEKGVFYEARNGSKIGPMRHCVGALQPWSGRDRTDGIVEFFNEDGRYRADGEESPMDLVAEWVDEPAPGVSGFTADDANVHGIGPDVGCGPNPDYVPPVTKKSVLEAAIQTVADRGVPYGGVEDNFNRIANLWNAHLENRYPDHSSFLAPRLGAADVAMMMALMKIARLEANPSHADSWIDVAGYAACGGEIGAKLTLDKSE